MPEPSVGGSQDQGPGPGSAEQGPGPSFPAGLSWECHAADQGTAERPQWRWVLLCSMCCVSQPMGQAEMDMVSRALPEPQDPSSNVGSCKQVQQEREMGSIHEDIS